jgi:hypothetical protein
MYDRDDWKSVHPAIRQHIEHCPVCENAMEPWMNNHRDEKYRVSYNVCRSCGYAMVFEEMFDFLGRWKPDIENDAHWDDMLNTILRGSRKMAAKFVSKETEDKALTAKTLRYITYEIMAWWVAEYENEREENIRATRLSETYKIPTEKPVPYTPAARQLDINRARKAEKEREERANQKKFPCKKCGKPHFKKQAKVNHERECKGEREEFRF